LAGIAERGFRNQRKCDSLSLVARSWGRRWRGGGDRAIRRICGRGCWRRLTAAWPRVRRRGCFGLVCRTSTKALIRRRRTGEVSASSRRGHRPRKLTVAQEAALASHIAAHPDLTLAALQIWLIDQHAGRLSNGAMWSAVARLGLSFKKRRSTPPSKTVPTSRPGAASGARRSLLLMPTSSSSSTRPAPAPR
jgi:transposase